MLSRLLIAAFVFLLPLTAQAQDAFERVEKTKILRCGYVVYPPLFTRDPNTGAFGGIFYDLTESIAKKAEWKVEWAVETDYSTYAEDMRTHKYDAYCAGKWPLVSDSKVSLFTQPLFFAGMGVFVRADDNRFDGKSLDDLNSEANTVAVVDGSGNLHVASMTVPKVKQLAIPQNSDFTMLLEMVRTKKADFTFLDRMVIDEYHKKNPGAFKNLFEDRPVRIFANVWAFPLGEDHLRDVFDTAAHELLNDGEVDRILAKYEPVPGKSFYRVDLPYK